MNQIKIILYTLISTFLFQTCRPEHKAQPDDGIAQKVEALLSRMTLEEKVGQMKRIVDAITEESSSMNISKKDLLVPC